MNKFFSLKIDDEEIVFADLTNRENTEVVAVCKSGNIFLCDAEKENTFLLNKLSFNPSQLNLQIHSFENYVCITQKNGLQGMVINLSDSNFQKSIARIDYQAEHCLFPIGVYRKENFTYLIHGTEWNRLDITCLETGELLTDRKSSNDFDYFHSSLLVSPDEKHFTSNGWVWSPYDVITIYTIERFLKEYESSSITINFEPVDGYNWDRPLCWIDNKTLGIGYNKKEDGESKEDFPSEIIFVDIIENRMVNRIDFDGFKLSEYGAAEGELYFDLSQKCFIGLNKKSGVLISDVDGKEIYRNETLNTFKYSPKHKLFYQIDFKKQELQVTQLRNLL